jgi:hypothetical protein
MLRFVDVILNSDIKLFFTSFKFPISLGEMRTFFFIATRLVLSFHTVEIHFRSDGSITIPYVVVAGLRSPTHEAVVTIDSHRVIDFGPNEQARDISGLMFIESNSVEFGDDRSDLIVTSYSDDATALTIGIGPGSYLVQRYGSVSVIRNSLNTSGSLIIGQLNADIFNNSCVADSIASIPYHSTGPRHTVNIHQSMRVTIGNPIRRVNNTSVTIEGGFGRIITVPLTMADRIIEIISSTGAIPIGTMREKFGNCYPESVLNILPDIILRFSPSNDVVVLFPEDYLTFENDECSLKIRVPQSEFWESRFDPLRIPSINLHISDGLILVCDRL